MMGASPVITLSQRVKNMLKTIRHCGQLYGSLSEITPCIYIFRLCKPHKMAWDNRWKPKDASLLDEAELEIANAVRISYKEPHDS